LVDKNYFKYFVQFIPYLKIITSKYFVNIDNIVFNEDECKYLIDLWHIYNKYSRENNIIIEIIKDNFTQILIKFYKKLKTIGLKIKFAEIFCDFSCVEGECNQMIINDGLFQLFSEEIDKYQYSNVILLTYLIFACSNFAIGSIEDNKILLNFGIIYKVMDIAIFYIDDKLDSEIISLLTNCINFFIKHIDFIDSESKKQIIVYKNSLIIKIFCKVLKLDLEIFTKQKILDKIIIIIKELKVASEEIGEENEKNYDMACISNSLVDILNNLYNKPCFNQVINDVIIENIDFIKDKEKYI
jgi:hypothetical protein